MNNNIEQQLELTLIMSDGTPLTEAPKNPLTEKWEKNYTLDRFGKQCQDILGHYEDGRPIMNYDCVLCTSKMCYKSDKFEVPEEDKEVYENYMEQLDSFYEEHSTIY